MAVSIARLLLALAPPVFARQAIASSVPSPHTFGWRGEHFLLDSKPFHIIAGEMHYARVPRLHWLDSTSSARTCTSSGYVCAVSFSILPVI